MLRIVVTDSAKADIHSAYLWWREHRSFEQAKRWYRGIHRSIQALRTSAARCPKAPESDLLPTGLRQLAFGLGRHQTHRIVFTIVKSDLIVLRVRHAAQDALTDDDVS